ETHYSHSFIGESDKHQKQVLGFLLLFFTGYFKKVSERMDDKDSKLIKFTIPNKEVKYIFRRKVLSWFEENIKTRDFTNMYNSILESKPEIFEKELSDVLIESISFNDAYENFYHGFVTGILSSMKGYTVKSNRESGNGRGDIFIRPVSRRKAAIILELKVCKNFNELEQRADDALKQIEEKKYEMELKDDGYNNIIKYGISFFKKDCFIKIKE
uniref:PD-(D/E)XK nuclease domain-containing protein n=1 Tax=uncultured Clostridium sp. TaxID=59620 RepID=UPI0025E50512